MALKFLIVEDEPLVALLLEDYLDLLGHETLEPIDNLADALEATRSGGFDAAIVDINLGTDKIWPLAEAMSQSAIPFIIASGEGLPSEISSFARAPLLAKPYNLNSVKAAIAQLSLR